MIKDFFLEVVNIFHSNHPFMLLISDVKSLLSSIWNYSIYTTADSQSILVGNLILGALLFIVGIMMAGRLSKRVKKALPHSLDTSTVSTLERMSYYFFLIIITFFVLDLANLPITVFTVVGTTLAIGIGLGSQHLTNNFISGLIIMAERPIRLGDIIEFKNIIGKVTNIGARCTSIKTAESITMLIPNSNILQDVIINWTLDDTIFKTGLIFSVSNNTTLETFDQVITEVLLNNASVLKMPPPQILLKAICKDYYVIEAEFWLNIGSSEMIKYVANDINRSLQKQLELQNIQVINEEAVMLAKVTKE